MKDYYKILEIEENSTQEEIKKKYRSLSKQYHPDVNPEGTERFKEIAEAYEILGDKNKRDQYDKSRNNPFSGTEFENFFSQMFVNSSGGNRVRKNVQDKVINVEISPVESYKGSDKTINYLKNVDCDVCRGTGGDRQVCSGCGGNGFTIRTYGTGYIVQQVRNVCSSCGGRGYTLIHKCGTCSGVGSKSQESNITFKIPIGVDSGQYIKFENYGDIVMGELGDLVLKFEVVTQDGFEKSNNDLIYNLFLGLEDLNSDKYVIPHPDGELKITPPKTFDTSRPLRLRNKGFNSGDMYINLHVKFDRE